MAVDRALSVAAIVALATVLATVAQDAELRVASFTKSSTSSACVNARGAKTAGTTLHIEGAR